MAAPATPAHASVVDKGPFCLVTQDLCPVQALARVRFLDSADKDQVRELRFVTALRTVKTHTEEILSYADREMEENMGPGFRLGLSTEYGMV